MNDNIIQEKYNTQSEIALLDRFMTKFLVCPPQDSHGDCALYVIAVAWMYYMERANQKEDFTAWTEDVVIRRLIVDHAYDLNHFFIKLPDDDYTAALLSKGLEQLTIKDPEVSVLTRSL